MNKYIEKIYEKGEDLYIYISKDVENAPQEAFKSIFDETEDENISIYKEKYFEYIYKTIYVYLPEGLECVKKGVFEQAFKDCIKKYSVSKDKKFFEMKIHFILPEGLKSIENRAFNFSHMHWVNLPKSVEYIGDKAFYAAFFDEEFKLEIPKNIKYIGEGAFSCFGGEFILHKNENYFSDGYAIYSKKEKKLLSYFGESKHLSYYEIWKEAEHICDCSICSGLYLKEIVIPYKINIIYSKTFLDCLSRPTIYLENFNTKIETFGIGGETKVVFPDKSFKIIENKEEEFGFSTNILKFFEFQYEEEKEDEFVEEFKEAEENKQQEIYTGEESNLDIEAIEKMLEENKKEAINDTSKNPFDFDADEIFKDVNYDYNPFDFEPVELEGYDDDEDLDNFDVLTDDEE